MNTTPALQWPDDFDLPAFLTPADLSALINIPEKTLAAWRSERKGPMFTRMGVHVRYPRSFVQTWLNERAAEAQRWMAS